MSFQFLKKIKKKEEEEEEIRDKTLLFYDFRAC